MAYQVVELECPGCGCPVTIDTEVCPQCFRTIVISSFNSVSSMSALELNKCASGYRKALSSNPNNKKLNMSVAFCYLKLKLYDKALPCFEKAIEDNFDNSELYFYAAVCCLGGKKAFLTPRGFIDKAEEYLNAATMIEPKGIYYYFWSYIKYDYYKRKFLRTTPDYVAMMQKARECRFSQSDVSELFEILNVDNPFKG